METLVQTKSTNTAKAFVLTELLPCPNADKLRIIKIPDSDYVYLANYEDWKDNIGKLVVYICPDTLVDTTLPQFKFLASDAKYNENSDTPGKYARVKAKRLRGTISFGLVVLAPEGVLEGEDCFNKLGLIRYEPENVDQVKKSKLDLGGSEVAKAPNVHAPKYDVDAFMKYGRKVFIEGELVTITEKINGCNAAFVYSNGEFHCKSRSEWKREYCTPPNITLEGLVEQITQHNEEKVEKATLEQIQERAKLIYEKQVLGFKSKQNQWWYLLRNTPGLMDWLQAHPDILVFGELYGKVKKFNYDCDNNSPIKFAIFDVMKDGKFLDFDEAYELTEGLPWVPILARNIPLDFNDLEKYYTGPSTLGNTKVREGCVVRPIKERWNSECGRVHLKLINPDY